MEQVTTLIGEPKNYGLSPEERKAAELKANVLKQEQQQQEAAEKERVEAELAARLAIELEKWVGTVCRGWHAHKSRGKQKPFGFSIRILV